MFSCIPLNRSLIAEYFVRDRVYFDVGAICYRKYHQFALFSLLRIKIKHGDSFPFSGKLTKLLVVAKNSFFFIYLRKLTYVYVLKDHEWQGQVRNDTITAEEQTKIGQNTSLTQLLCLEFYSFFFF